MNLKSRVIDLSQRGMKVRDIACQCECSEGHVRRLRREARAAGMTIPHAKKQGPHRRAVLVLNAELRDWLERTGRPRRLSTEATAREILVAVRQCRMGPALLEVQRARRLGQ